VGDSARNGEDGFLRILIVEGDEIGAFVAHCEINKLPYACSIQRLSKTEELQDKIPQFKPRFILIGESFTAPRLVSNIRQSGITLPIICISKNGDSKTAEEVLKAGATDSLYSAQVSELARCLEGHLSGNAVMPFYSQGNELPPGSRFSLWIGKLDVFSREKWTWTRNAIATAPAQFRKLGKQCRCELDRFRAFCSDLWVKTRNWYWSKKARRVDVGDPHQIATVVSPLSEPHHENGNTRISLRKVGSRAAQKFSTFWMHHESRVRDNGVAEPYGRTHTVSSEKDENSEAFRALELSFKTLFHTSLDGLLLLDNTGKILHANSAARSLLGLSAVDLLGKKLLGFVPMNDKAEVEAFWEMLLTLANHEADLLILTARGEIKSIHLRGRTNLWFGVHLLILKDMTPMETLKRQLAADRAVLNPI